MSWRKRLPEITVAAIVTVAYVWACFSDVVCEGLNAGPFDLAAVTGLSCVLTGWMDYPIGWLANPLIWVGVGFLVCGRSGPAALCGLLAIIPVALWSIEWNSLGLWHMLRIGYSLWLMTIALLTVGSTAIYIDRSLLKMERPPGELPIKMLPTQ